MSLLLGCGVRSQVITKVELQKQEIPKELLEYKKLDRITANNELDILNGFSLLFYNYKQCTSKLDKIKELNYY